MAVMAKWGNKTWEVSASKANALESLAFSWTQLADNQSGTEDNSISKHRGTELFPLTFKTTLVSGLGYDVWEEIQDWKKHVTAIEYFYLNGRKLGPKLQLRQVAVSDVLTDDQGRIRKAVLSFEFKEYNKKSTSYIGISALDVGPDEAWLSGQRNIKETKKIKKGSWVKIKGKKYTNGKKIPSKVKKKKWKVKKISGNKVTLKGLKYKVRKKDLSLVK